MSLKGYYLETLYPRFSIYRVIIIGSFNTLETYQIAVNLGEDVKDRLPGYLDLGGILNERIR